MESLMDEIIERYGSVMDEVAAKGMRFAVLGPPPTTRQGNKHNRPVYATLEMHKYIYPEFNRRLGAHCAKKGYLFIDVQSYVVGADGFTQPRFAADDVHLNRVAAKWVRRQLMEAFIAVP
jgi:hypothetical protein